jgi:hypothetical protein
MGCKALHKLHIEVRLVRVTGRESLQVCETFEVPHFLDNRLTDGGEVVSLTHQPSYKPLEVAKLLLKRPAYVPTYTYTKPSFIGRCVVLRKFRSDGFIAGVYGRRFSFKLFIQRFS